MAIKHIIIDKTVFSQAIWIATLNVKGGGKKIFGYSR